MLMRLLWGLIEPIVAPILGLLPDAPEPVDIVIPWPEWVPFWPFALGIGLIIVVGSATIALRFLRWVYGLIPVIQ